MAGSAAVKRRIVTIPVVFLLAAVLWILAPVWFLVAGIVVNFFAPSGIVNLILMKLGASELTYFVTKPEWFRPIFIGTGIWQETSQSTPVAGGGDIDIAASSLTLYWDFWFWNRIHPYVGLGAGIGYAKGSYVEENDDITVKEFIPVIHIPVGLAFDLGETFRFSLEGRVIDGWSWGGLFQIRF